MTVFPGPTYLFLPVFPFPEPFILGYAMKRLSMLLAALLVCLSPLQASEYSRDYLEQRKKKFQGMKTTGAVMGVSGVALLVGGILLASNADWETQETTTGGTQTTTQDPSGAFGLLFIGSGISLGITGAILGGIGSRKVKQYDALLQSSALNFELGEQRKALRLSYSF